MKNSFLVLAIITLAFLSGCRNQACTVGQIKITDQDIDYRAKVSEIYYPGSGKRYVGLAQLIKGYLALEILKTLGHPADAAKIEAEAQRIDTSTKAPETLQKIKDVFVENRQAYLNVFVKQVYAERVLYSEIFLKTSDNQLEPRNQPETFRTDSVVVPKKSFDEWFWAKAAKIPVRIKDKTLKNELLSEVSWAKQLFLQN